MRLILNFHNNFYNFDTNWHWVVKIISLYRVQDPIELLNGISNMFINDDSLYLKKNVKKRRGSRRGCNVKPIYIIHINFYEILISNFIIKFNSN